MGFRHAIAAVALAATAFTVLVTVLEDVQLAYRSPTMHVALEVTAAVVATVAAQLFYGRFRRRLQLRDLLLAASLVVFAVSNLCFSAIPAIAQSELGAFGTWAPVGGRTLGSALLAASALAPDRALRRPGRDALRVLAGAVLGLAAIAVGVAATSGTLPAAIEPGLSPESSTSPRIVGNPVVLTAQALQIVLFTIAAAGFVRRADRTADVLLRWVAAGCVLGAFARVNFFLFPSLYSEWIYTGDALRLGFQLCLLAGGLLEIRATQEELAGVAVEGERRRLARELHDGIAQDVAFMLQQARALASRTSGADQAAALAIETAAQRALDDSRQAISALVRPPDAPLGEDLERTAAELAGRTGLRIDVGDVPDVRVPAEAQHALLRVLREAVGNAARHGGATRVRIALEDGPVLALRITDDGTGFDVTQAAEAPGRHGLRSMRERMQAVGGEVRLDSAPGRGTEVLVTLP